MLVSDPGLGPEDLVTCGPGEGQEISLGSEGGEGATAIGEMVRCGPQAWVKPGSGLGQALSPGSGKPG